MHAPLILRQTVLVAALGVFALLSGCNSKESGVPAASIEHEPQVAVAKTADTQAVDPVQLTGTTDPHAQPNPTMEVHQPEVLITTSMGNIRLRLDPAKAPRTVENFLYNYVEREFYDNTIIHYIDADSMICAGGYDTNYKFKEPRTPILCEANNGLHNRKGTVAMAHHADDVNSATSQFFINLVDNPGLDYQPNDEGEVNGYCVFGEVIDGMDVVEKIASVSVHDRDEFPKTPTKPVIIKSVRRVK